MVAMATPQKHPKTGIFQLRIAVPNELRPKLGKREIKKTLGTRCPTEAKRRFAEEAAKTYALFERARSGYTLTKIEAKALAGEWLRERLDEDERERRERDPEGERLPDADGGFETVHETALELLERYREQGDLVRAAGVEADEIIQAKGLPVIAGSADYQRLVVELLPAKHELLRTLHHRALNDWSRVLDLSTYPDPEPPPVTLVKPIPVHGAGPGLSEIFEKWAARSKASSNTAREFKKAISRFVELHGDVPPVAVTRRMVGEFLDALYRLPRHPAGKLRAMTVPQLLEATKDAPPAATLSDGTVKKNLTGLSTVLTWAKRNGYCDSVAHWSNPAHDWGLKDSSDSGEEKRLPYVSADLTRIFNMPIFTEGERPRGSGGEAAKWLPLLALHSGARLEEIGQLWVSDVAEEDGIWRFDINTLDDGTPENRKSVKNKSSRRKVPIHPGLIRCGFIEYWKAQKASGHTRLFPDLRRDSKGRLTGNFSKWWRRYTKANGVDPDPRKVFHSFRHTWKDAARAAEIAEEVHDAITGHSGSSVGRTYGGRDRPLRVLARNMALIKYEGLDLSHLFTD